MRVCHPIFLVAEVYSDVSSYTVAESGCVMYCEGSAEYEIAGVSNSFIFKLIFQLLCIIVFCYSLTNILNVNFHYCRHW